jgi:hypothetical protein
MVGLVKRRHELTAAELIDGLRALHLTPADLTALIGLTQEFIAEDLERRVQVVKQSADGSGQPIESLRLMLVRGECPCRATMRLCEGDNR